jgi:hypothetical protein
MKLIKSVLKILPPAACFAFMWVLGVAAFNLFYLSEKLQMLRVVNEFHAAQISNDKDTINKLLTDDFSETGAKRVVEAPDFIYKKDLLRFDYSQLKFAIQTKYLLPANILNNRRDSLSFVKEINFLSEDSKKRPPIIFLVTYTFEDSADGLKISHIERLF